MHGWMDVVVKFVGSTLTGNCLRFLPGLPTLQEALLLADFSSVIRSMSSIVLSPCQQQKKTHHAHHDLDSVSYNNWSNSALIYGNVKLTLQAWMHIRHCIFPGYERLYLYIQ